MFREFWSKNNNTNGKYNCIRCKPSCLDLFFISLDFSLLSSLLLPRNEHNEICWMMCR